ncbi:unnamed protein product [Spirodela intermedia]|uniref:Uncharacterized protein n=1 Tax=Spirodela intermedia TaxID=51605 RepID=A0A7I8K9Q1_SPIIN|nr:unnamed protein product [Spirodela intermedia]
MTSQALQCDRDGAEITRGDAECREKIQAMLKELSLPPGLLPVEDISELGLNRSTGFFWVTQKRKREHAFKKIKRQVSYAAEVTALVDNRRIRRITGVKAKELLFWFSIAEIYIDDPSSERITFKTGLGLSKSFPVSAFELEQETNPDPPAE